MNNEPKHGMECSEFEALLADALDNAISRRRRGRRLMSMAEAAWSAGRCWLKPWKAC